MTIRYKRLARADLDGIVHYLQMQDSQQLLHRRFLASFDEACNTLLHFPHIGRSQPMADASRDAHYDLRRLPVGGFPKYLIFYTVRNDAVLIERILHTARNPILRLTDPS